jgi:hypothetical protein
MQRVLELPVHMTGGCCAGDERTQRDCFVRHGLHRQLEQLCRCHGGVRPIVADVAGRPVAVPAQLSPRVYTTTSVLAGGWRNQGKIACAREAAAVATEGGRGADQTGFDLDVVEI